MKPTNRWTRVDFSKTSADADRLRIIGRLVLGPASAAQVAEDLHMPVEVAQNQLDILARSEILMGGYQLSVQSLLERAKSPSDAPMESYLPAPNLDATGLNQLAAYLKRDGSLRQIPSAPAKLQTVLHYLVSAFTPGADYSEKEVNTVLRMFHLDVAGVRRDLIASGLMAREQDGSRYWRVVGQP